MSEKAPHETEAYQRLTSDINATKSLLFSERNKLIAFEVQYPDGSKRTLHFKRLRATEWDHVISEINQLGDMSKATKEQLDKLYTVMCLALGYTSGDGLNAQDWKDLDDKLLVESCYFKLIDISGISKEAVENLSWFHQYWGRQNESSSVPKNEQVAV